MPEILVSVLTPCFNSEKTIEQTLTSIENQTYCNIEYLIIDGGSVDHTLKLIDQHRKRLPKRFTVISEKDKGVYDAMNKGISLAKGQLIGIVNSDDWYENDTVEQAVRNYQGSPYEVIYGMQRNLVNDKEKTTFIHHHDFLPEQMITHPTCFVTKHAYNRFGLFNTQYRSAADYDLMLRYWESQQVVFTPVMKVMSNFRLGGISSSQVGVRENALIRYQHGYMSKRRYYFVTLKSHLYEKLHKSD